MSSANARFVSVPSAAFDDAFAEITQKVIRAGGNARWVKAGRERVFEVLVPGERIATGFRVFTSTAVDSTSARECGKDAVRIVVGAWKEGAFKPTAKSRRILRTAPKGADESKRVEAFIERLVGHMRTAYKEAATVEECRCGHAMALRSPRTGSDFYGCTNYPECRNTRPAHV